MPPPGKQDADKGGTSFVAGAAPPAFYAQQQVRRKRERDAGD
jgi:hypothetical protein